jgi:hypothetical protein
MKVRKQWNYIVTLINQSLTIFCHKTLKNVSILCNDTESLRYFYPFRYLPSTCKFASQVAESLYLLS